MSFTIRRIGDNAEGFPEENQQREALSIARSAFPPVMQDGSIGKIASWLDMVERDDLIDLKDHAAVGTRFCSEHLFSQKQRCLFNSLLRCEEEAGTVLIELLTSPNERLRKSLTLLFFLEEARTSHSSREKLCCKLLAALESDDHRYEHLLLMNQTLLQIIAESDQNLNLGIISAFKKWTGQLFASSLKNDMVKGICSNSNVLSGFLDIIEKSAGSRNFYNFILNDGRDHLGMVINNLLQNPTIASEGYIKLFPKLTVSGESVYGSHVSKKFFRYSALQELPDNLQDRLNRMPPVIHFHMIYLLEAYLAQNQYVELRKNYIDRVFSLLQDGQELDFDPITMSCFCNGIMQRYAKHFLRHIKQIASNEQSLNIPQQHFLSAFAKNRIVQNRKQLFKNKDSDFCASKAINVGFPPEFVLLFIDPAKLPEPVVRLFLNAFNRFNQNILLMEEIEEMSFFISFQFQRLMDFFMRGIDNSSTAFRQNRSGQNRLVSRVTSLYEAEVQQANLFFYRLITSRQFFYRLLTNDSHFFLLSEELSTLAQRCSTNQLTQAACCMMRFNIKTTPGEMPYTFVDRAMFAYSYSKLMDTFFKKLKDADPGKYEAVLYQLVKKGLNSDGSVNAGWWANPRFLPFIYSDYDSFSRSDLGRFLNKTTVKEDILSIVTKLYQMLKLRSVRLAVTDSGGEYVPAEISNRAKGKVKRTIAQKMGQYGHDIVQDLISYFCLDGSE